MSVSQESLEEQGHAVDGRGVRGPRLGGGEGPPCTLFVSQVCLDGERMFPLHTDTGQQQHCAQSGDILRKVTEWGLSLVRSTLGCVISIVRWHLRALRMGLSLHWDSDSRVNPSFVNRWAPGPLKRKPMLPDGCGLSLPTSIDCSRLLPTEIPRTKRKKGI